ncbi:MAG: tRNA (adenosine(37)-N6)-threonylcarbamoyltransferase complex dimerization subunit type 1 TsaB [Pseudomonadales bacterium]
MKNVLAMETSGDFCTVGLLLDGNRFHIHEHVDKRHNERLLPLLGDLISMAGISRAELIGNLHAVAFGRGPGSFTGVRIAAAAAQALALAAGARVLRVGSSEILAEGVLRKVPAAPGVVTSIRSRRDLHYLATWRNIEGVPMVEQRDQLHAESPDAAFYEHCEGWPVAGETPGWWRGPAPLPHRPDGDDLLTAAIRCLSRGEDVDPSQALPEYLSGDSPWRKVRP